METTRRNVLKTAALAAAPIAAQRRRSSRPHILLLMADQFRGDCLGSGGNRAIQTPNLDRLAAEGARFRCAYSSMPTCTPARSGLLTGLAPWNHGMLKMIAMANRYPVEKPRAMREAGYYTAAIGKNHFHPQRNGHGYHHMLLDESGRAESQEYRSDYRSWFWSEAPNLDPDKTGLGWNDYRARPYALPERLHPTAWTGQCAVNFIESYNRPEPMFLKVSFARPHSPYDPPERLWRKYGEADLPKAAVGAWASKYAPRSDDSNDIWHGDVGADTVRNSRRGYYASISFVDEQIGRILKTLEKRRLLDETLIVFFSDHGDMTGDHNLWRKSYAYEASARIPMLVRWAGGMASGKRGQTLSQTVELRDMLPTFLDAAGAAPRAQLDGRSLLPLLSGKTEGWREYLDLEHGVCYSPRNHWNALTDGRVKYIYHAYDGEEQLFDLERDPHELNDLASLPSASARLSEWRNRMIAHLAPRGDAFVRGGRLVPRPQDMPSSPNFPDRKA
ncbi:MAG TPA: arylsulfatase [Bryobacteraceae bacterium]|nr:arylsulfatase [Bryobacteraceae bacterium]